jgi:hypothetical protein
VSAPDHVTVVFASLALNQARFYHAVAALLERAGLRAAHLCFHERSHEWLAALGARSFNAFALQPARSDAVTLAEYGIADAERLLVHERAAYELHDDTRLLAKLKGHLHAASAAFGTLAAEDADGIVLVQELGGFLSVLATYYAARARGINNWFVEPSFFRGRLFFTRNSFAAPVVAGPEELDVQGEVAAYLEQALRQQSVVIPAKDVHHYRGAAAKLTDLRNLRRLAEKTWDRHVLGKREEFEHAGGHVARHVRMFVNGVRLKPRYRTLADAGRFVYFPLHVPADFALTIRSPEYLDQCALVDRICVSVPATHCVAIKEHPALIGALPYARIAELQRRHANLVVLDPSLNNYAVLGAADAVITVNSKSGAEALLIGRPVIVLGDAFYRHCTLVRAETELARLPAAIAAALAQPAPPRAEVARYFQGVWNRSRPGELYDLSGANVEAFAQSVIDVLAGWPAPVCG